MKSKKSNWAIAIVLAAGISLSAMACDRKDSRKQKSKSLDAMSFEIASKVKEDNQSNLYGNEVELDRAVQEEMRSQKLYGLAIAIVKEGKIIYLKGYGYEDVENKIPVKAKQTMFRWASISKSITGVAAAQEVFAGNLDLDADVRKYVPEYKFPTTYSYPLENGKFDVRSLPESPKSLITTRTLLHHTAGIKNFNNGPNSAGRPPDNLANDPNTNIGIFWAGQYFWNDPNHLLYIPGTTYSYSVYGYTLAGMVIERVGDSKSYWEKVRDRIAVPFGMTPASFPNRPQAGYQSGSFFQPDYEWVNIPHRAIGYKYNKDSNLYERSGSTDISWRMPSAGFISTVENMAQYCNGLINREDIISAKMKEELLWKGGQLSDGTLTPHGPGFGIGSRNNKKIIGTLGGQQKARTRMIIYPDDKLCFAAMSNSEWANIEKIVDVVEDTYRKLAQ